MAMQQLVWVLVLATVGGVSNGQTICVTLNSEGEFSCSGSNIHCSSWKCIIERISDGTQVYFQTLQFNLSSPIHITGKRNIAFIGRDTDVFGKPTDFTGVGLKFTNIQNLTIKNLIFHHCGALQNSTLLNITTDNSTQLFRTAIYIYNSTDVHIENVHISNSNGVGLSFFDTDGTVNVTNSLFQHNKIPQPEIIKYPGGGGMRVEFTYCPPGIFCEYPHSNQHNSNSRYIVFGCEFFNNTANARHISGPISPSYRASRLNDVGRGQGGGLGVYFNNASNNSIEITQCVFSVNQAQVGGGLYLKFHGCNDNNTVNISNSIFEKNMAEIFGGGTHMGNRLSGCDKTVENIVMFEHCNFTKNEAKGGGGVSIALGKRYQDILSTSFTSCKWHGNKGHYGSAVHAAPSSWEWYFEGTSQPPVYDSCNFTGNVVIPKYEDKYTNHSGHGTFYISSITVQFKTTLYFENNEGSALHVTSGTLKFDAGMIAEFVNNSAYEGGAIALYGISSFNVKDDSIFTFVNNSVCNKGGAIFVQFIDKHFDSAFHHSCFLQYDEDGNRSPQDHNISFVFRGNKAGCTGILEFQETSEIQSLFITSVKPCFQACYLNKQKSTLQMDNIFSCIGEFNYLDSLNSKQIFTSGEKFCSETQHLLVIPGKSFKLPFEVIDDMNNNVPVLYFVRVDNSSITITNPYIHSRANRIELYGHPGAKTELEVTLQGSHAISTSLMVELDDCPPGFVILPEAEDPKCECSKGTRFEYEGIALCNTTSFTASLQRNYWAGYIFNDTLNSTELFTGQCRICDNIDRQLPSTRRDLEDNKDFCLEGREGRFCANCIENHSAFYHGQHVMHCRPNRLCSLSWLFYILSELVPLSLLFLVAMIFNINFTSGAANGFILFAQITASIYAETLHVPEAGHWQIIYKVARAHIVLYRFLNFEMFTAHSLAFCLWESANTIDVLVFKYVTTAYAFLLIVVTVIIMNYCNCYRRCSSLRPQTVKSSVTHGLSTFLILCYTQCTQVSMYILTPVTLYSKGKEVNIRAVYYQGDLDYLKGRHLFYAIPALLCLSTLTVIPPLILILYPLSLKVIVFLHLEESRAVKFLSRFFPMVRIKPLLDSFQGCFKDDYRFFSGFYFLYRCSILLVSSFTDSTIIYFQVVVVFLLTMLLFNALAQPYKNRWHNIIDSLLFADLALINALSLVSWYYHMQDKPRFNFKAVQAIQAILELLPFLCMIAFLITKTKLFRKLTETLKIKTIKLREQEEIELPARLVESGSECTWDSSLRDTVSGDYQQLGDS